MVTESDKDPFVASEDLTETFFIFNDLTVGEDYKFEVFSVNQFDQSEPTSYETTILDDPDAPKNLREVTD